METHKPRRRTVTMPDGSGRVRVTAHEYTHALIYRREGWHVYSWHRGELNAARACHRFMARVGAAVLDDWYDGVEINSVRLVKVNP